VISRKFKWILVVQLIIFIRRVAHYSTRFWRIVTPIIHRFTIVNERSNKSILLLQLLIHCRFLFVVPFDFELQFGDVQELDAFVEICMTVCRKRRNWSFKNLSRTWNSNCLLFSITTWNAYWTI
jgi:hypothetical protein